MNFRFRRLAAWSGVVAMVVFFSGFIIAMMIPPTSPSMPIEEIISSYTERLNYLRLGFILVFLSPIFVFPFFTLISLYLRKIEGAEFPLFSLTQLAAGSANAVIFLLGPMVILVMLFRMERPPELTLLMFDFSWIWLVLPFVPNLVQCLCIAGCIFLDEAKEAVFPRWLGYFNLWIAIGFVPAVTGFFFKDGPFAWNGLLPFWLAGAVFASWFLVMVWQLLRAIKLEEEQSG